MIFGETVRHTTRPLGSMAESELLQNLMTADQSPPCHLVLDASGNPLAIVIDLSKTPKPAAGDLDAKPEVTGPQAAGLRKLSELLRF